MKRQKAKATTTKIRVDRMSQIKKSKYLYIIFTIPFLYFILFHYMPMYGVVVAFQDYNIVAGISGSEWVGFKHFQKFLTDSYFWKIVRNTLLLNIYGLIFGFPLPIILALLLNELKNGKFKKIVQSVSYLPHFISTVVVCGMITNFLASDGLINKILNFFGQKSIQFLMFPEYFRTIFTSTSIWQSLGWNSIIYLSALTAVDQEVVEAAMIDGAGRFRRIRHVMLPSIAPTVSVMLIMQLGKLMTLGYEKILLLYNGSTYETADVISTYVYRRGILSNSLSYATAVGLFQSIIGLLLLISSNKISKKVSETSMW